MNETFNFEEFLKVLRENFKLIIGLMLLGGLVSTAITSFLIEPIYETNTQVLVSQSQSRETITNTDIQASLQLVNTYSDIIKSPSILEEVVKNLDLEYGTSGLSSMIDVSSQNQSQVLNISVTNEKPETAEKIANELANVFQKKIPKIMNVDNVSILAKADVGDNPQPIFPKPIINLGLGIIVGGLIGLALALFRSMLDKRITTEDDVQKYLELPVMGTVAEFK
ncbi:capsule biosynthesis protein [Macrococcus hajekii]|uniref:Capsule biosynthesis protein n=1 Tax=Macrococcus hajekii TaxID=198482 RepID=A0A4R6BND5_9STAP|nr:Wzz/FepE/Etk N-terminal domain-containing protein [Macrococcus hajekii]TDM03374.1 capsule biosynthesis protein [Macrococcus hajekii]GGA98333.1 putative capsular polysaccharide biosynthesis protein YwqC [Macrococcus hajekii]